MAILVKEVIDTQAPFCNQFDTAKSAVAIMRRSGVAFLPVVENEPPHAYVGAVTDRDLLHELANGLSPETGLSEVVGYRNATCADDDPLDKAMQIMRREKVGDLAVLNDEGHYLGIVTLDDIARRLMPPAKNSAPAVSARTRAGGARKR
jgi:CBS domain-containing protein